MLAIGAVSIMGALYGVHAYSEKLQRDSDATVDRAAR